jgi:hypothetical protein
MKNATSQKTAFFIVTAVKTSNLTKGNYIFWGHLFPHTSVRRPTKCERDNPLLISKNQSLTFHL